MNIILFDANSTSVVSGLIAVAPGECILLNSWGLDAGETATVHRVFMSQGEIPEQSGSCDPPKKLRGAEQLADAPYLPCNVTVAVGQSVDQSLSSIVLQQPGFYRVYLTPSALGTAIVEAVILSGAEACQQAASQCCCLPETFFAAASTNPCLSITPGGEAGHRPTFNLDACCLLESFPQLLTPAPTDELVVLSGGSCFRSTVQSITDLAVVCPALQGFLLQPPAVNDTIVVVSGANECVRRDAETLVEFFETPWTGISATPGLVITAGGINGHGPTFTYTVCTDLMALPACSCEPSVGDQFVIIQGGNCTLATWPDLNLCNFIGTLPVGAIVAGDVVVVRDTADNCKVVDASGFGFDGGTIVAPILGANGDCTAPTYSFTASPDSGMWYDPAGVGQVVISDDNCVDEIRVGASITLRTTATDITVDSGGQIIGIAAAAIGLNAGLSFTATAQTFATITAATGAVNLNGSVGINLTTTIGAIINNSASSIQNAATSFFDIATGGLTRITIQSNGAWDVGGSVGAGGEVLTSNGPGTPPTWQPAGGASVIEPSTQIVYGTGVGVDSSSFFLYDVSNGRFNVNITTGASVLSTPGNQLPVRIYGSQSNNAGTGADVIIHAADSPDGTNAGRSVEISGGNASVLDRQAGGVNIFGGDASGVSGNAQGGIIEILAGDPGATGQRPGWVHIRPGQMTGADIQGNTAYVEIGRANGMGLRLPSKSTEVSELRGHDGYLATEKGQDVRIRGGRGFPLGNTDGGDVLLVTGVALGSGVGGRVSVSADKGGFESPIAYFTHFGDTVMAGYGSGTNGTQNNTIPAGATTGFLWPPRIAGTPVGVPAGTDIPGGTTYANPMAIQQGASVTNLWMYNFSAAAWHTVAFNASGAVVSSVPINNIDNATGSATRAHGANAINWGWSGLAAFQAGLTLTESASSSNAILLNLINNDTVNSPEVFRADWRASGLFSIGGGNNDRWTASGGANGNNITISAGSNSGGNGGALVLNGGASSGNTGGGVNLTVGQGIQGGNFLGIAGTSFGSATVGGDFQCFGGPQTHVTGIRGGTVVLRGGDATNNPTLQHGNIYLNADLPANIATTATSGFVYLPKTAGGSPAGTPVVTPATGLPMILDVAGSTVVMHVYDGTAWRSVVLT